MSIDTRYTAKEALAWETYDDNTMAWVRGEKGHPGAPPAGYLEAYMLRHPRAPLPSHFPATEAAWANRHATGECDSCSATAYNSEAEDDIAAAAPVKRESGTGVSLSNDAFTTLLNHQALVTHQISALATTRNAAPIAPRPRYGKFGENACLSKAKFGHNSGPIAAKAWQRRGVAKHVAKGNGKKRYHSKRVRARLAAVKADTAEVAGPSGAIEMASEEAQEGEAEPGQIVAPEDVFMADYTKLKDDDDYIGVESLFGDEDSDEKAPVSAN
ncbi:hypothetical protein C8J57DRAFT_1512850 [Mycena rebaudengoi]|nr:hypothetical protein C8J57DRAFT_1512850 [Mycena rebaudengoi]